MFNYLLIRYPLSVDNHCLSLRKIFIIISFILVHTEDWQINRYNYGWRRCWVRVVQSGHINSDSAKTVFKLQQETLKREVCVKHMQSSGNQIGYWSNPAKIKQADKRFTTFNTFFKLYIFELMQWMSFSVRIPLQMTESGYFVYAHKALHCESRLDETLGSKSPKVHRKGHIMLTCLSLGLPLCLFYSLVAGTFRNCVPSWKLLLPLQFSCKKLLATKSLPSRFECRSWAIKAWSECV